MPHQGSLSGEMGREKFAVELHTFQTFGLTALLQKLYDGLCCGVLGFCDVVFGAMCNVLVTHAVCYVCAFVMF